MDIYPMREKLGSFFEFISSASQSRTTALLVILVVAAAVPLTVLVAQKQQSLQQKADSSYCYAQTNPNFCTAANGCQWSESASIPPGQVYGGGASSGGCIPSSTGGSSTGSGSTGGGSTTTTQTTYSCQGNQICTSINGGTPSCSPCTNGLNCVMTAGTPTCTGGTTTTPPSTGTTPSCTITASPTTVASGGTVTLYLTTQNTTNLGSCRVVDQNGNIQDPSTLRPFDSVPNMKSFPITQNSTFSLQCPVGTTLCSSSLVTVSGTTSTGTTPTPTSTTTTSGTPNQCSQQYFGCSITSSSCLDTAKTGANCLANWTNYFTCTGSNQTSAQQQAQSVCAAGSGSTNVFSRADLDRDRDVDIFDYNILISCSIFGTDNKAVCSSFFGNADLDSNGVVNETDYNTWLRIQKGTST